MRQVKNKFELFARSEDLPKYRAYLKRMLSFKQYTKVDEANHKMWQIEFDQIKEIMER